MSSTYLLVVNNARLPLFFRPQWKRMSMSTNWNSWRWVKMWRSCAQEANEDEIHVAFWRKNCMKLTMLPSKSSLIAVELERWESSKLSLRPMLRMTLLRSPPVMACSVSCGSWFAATGKRVWICRLLPRQQSSFWSFCVDDVVFQIKSRKSDDKFKYQESINKRGTSAEERVSFKRSTDQEHPRRPDTF